MDVAREGRGRGVILVVESNAANRALLKLDLVNAGYHVVEADSAVEGCYAVLVTTPHLIICNAMLPYIDGYEFAKAMKSNPMTCDIPVVFLLAHDDVADKAEEVGAAAYLPQPIATSRLLDVVALFVPERTPPV